MSARAARASRWATVARASGVHGLHWTQRSARPLVLRSDDGRLLIAVGRNAHHPDLVAVKARLCTTSAPVLERVRALAGRPRQLTLTLSTTAGQPVQRATLRVDGVADETTRLLSEDPYVPVSLDQDPVVLDPFMLLRIGRDHPAAVRALVDQVEVAEDAVQDERDGEVQVAGSELVLHLGRQRGAGNARGDQGRVAQQRPDLVGRQRNRRGLAQCHHDYAASRRWISSCMMVVRQWMRGSSGGWPPQALCRPQRLSQITISPTRHLCR